jgi:hypothetical protein
MKKPVKPVRKLNERHEIPIDDNQSFMGIRNLLRTKFSREFVDSEINVCWEWTDYEDGYLYVEVYFDETDEAFTAREVEYAAELAEYEVWYAKEKEKRAERAKKKKAKQIDSTQKEIEKLQKKLKQLTE